MAQMAANTMIRKRMDVQPVFNEKREVTCWVKSGTKAESAFFRAIGGPGQEKGFYTNRAAYDASKQV